MFAKAIEPFCGRFSAAVPGLIHRTNISWYLVSCFVFCGSGVRVSITLSAGVSHSILTQCRNSGCSSQMLSNSDKTTVVIPILNNSPLFMLNCKFCADSPGDRLGDQQACLTRLNTPEHACSCPQLHTAAVWPSHDFYLSLWLIEQCMYEK